MHEDVRKIVEQIGALEAQLRDRLHAQEAGILYRLQGTRIEFEQEIRDRHRRLRVNLFRWLARSQWRNIASAPFIYALIVPFAILDLFLTLYKHICFPLYGLARIRRSDFIAIDHQHLHYLNSIQRLNCVYCSYVNGLIAYTREIASITEQYWCPIKHARRVLGTHARYAHFLDYGDAESMPIKVRDLREELRASPAPAGPGD
jgi:hypothetical protein